MATAPKIENDGTLLTLPELYDRYVATFATKDVAQIVALHAEDGSFWLHSGREPVVGRAAIATAFQGFFDQWPEFGFELYRTLFTESGWVLDWSITAVLSGASGRRPISFHALDVVDVDAQGLVARKDTFIDFVQMKAAIAG